MASADNTNNVIDSKIINRQINYRIIKAAWELCGNKLGDLYMGRHCDCKTCNEGTCDKKVVAGENKHCMFIYFGLTKNIMDKLIYNQSDYKLINQKSKWLESTTGISEKYLNGGACILNDKCRNEIEVALNNYYEDLIGKDELTKSLEACLYKPLDKAVEKLEEQNPLEWDIHQPLSQLVYFCKYQEPITELNKVKRLGIALDEIEHIDWDKYKGSDIIRSSLVGWEDRINKIGALIKTYRGK